MPQNAASDQGLLFAIYPTGFSKRDLFSFLKKKKKKKKGVKVSQYFGQIRTLSAIQRYGDIHEMPYRFLIQLRFYGPETDDYPS